MTRPRSELVPNGAAGAYHCVQRCVRRAFLCGMDQYTGQSFEHRKEWVEARIRLIGECFAVAIDAYAVMSNHLHLVLRIDPSVAAEWGDGFGNGWVRVAGSVQDLMALAERIGRQWLKGIGLALRLG